MKSISIIECRTCGTQFFDSKTTVKLDPGEELDVVLRTIQHCSQCKLHDDRTPAQRRPRNPEEGW